MISVAHVHLEEPIELSSEFVRTLTIESPTEFYDMVCDLSARFAGEEGNFVFTRDEKQIAPSSVGEFVRDVFSVDFADRKIVSAVHKALGAIVAQAGTFERIGKVQTALAEWFEELFSEFPIGLEYDEPEPDALFKACVVRPLAKAENLLERLICLINLFVGIKRTEFFVFVDLKRVLSAENLRQLFEHCRREKVALLLVESRVTRAPEAFERGVVITEDLCEILAPSPPDML